MMSFNIEGAIANGQGGQEYLVVPTSVFTKWMNKFDEKYAKDPISYSRLPLADY